MLRKDGPKPVSVQPLDLPSAKDEGRLIIVEFETFFVVLAYVPNSGEGLKRLDERIGQWDAQTANYALPKRGKTLRKKCNSATGMKTL